MHFAKFYQKTFKVCKMRSIIQLIGGVRMFGKRLRELRKKANLTMKELGKKFSLAESTISGYENGNRKPDMEIIQDLADFFEVSVDYLLGRTDDPSPSKEGLAFFGGIKVDELTDEEKEYLEKNMEKSLAEFRELRARFLANKDKK
jgi:transcriptional regulator with XRE-family HTH domain